jgi:hypothetical protein
MDTTIKRSDLQARDICFLLDINYMGGLFRFSTFPIDIDDEQENTTIRYFGGLADPDINMQTEIVGFNPESNKISLELIFPDINWVTEWTRGRVLDNASCQLSMITVKNNKTNFTMQNRVSLFSGFASGAIFGTPDKPTGHVAFTIENDLLITDRKVIQDYQYLEKFEFPLIWNPSEGKIIPFVFGKPGGWPRPGGDYFDFNGNSGAVPTYSGIFTNGSLFEFIVSYDVTPAGNIRVFDSEGGFFENPIETATDSNGQIYSYVAYNFGSPPELVDNNFNATGVQDLTYWLDFSDSNGAQTSPYTDGILQGAGDICIYFLERSGLAFDVEAWHGVRLFLNKYKFDGYINDPNSTWFEWLKESIIKYLPIEVVNSGRGLKPVVNLYFTSEEINPSHYVTDSGDFQIVTGLQPLDVEIVNSIKLFYAFDGAYEKFNAILRFNPDLDPRKNYMPTYIPTQIGKMSMEQYGLQEKIIEIYNLYDLDTAMRIGHDMLRMQAMGAMALEVSAAASMGYIDVGDILSLSSSHLGFTNYKCQIVSKSWQGNRWRFIIHLENNSLINPNQS